VLSKTSWAPERPGLVLALVIDNADEVDKEEDAGFSALRIQLRAREEAHFLYFHDESSKC
jgi:hypothetical protein